MFRVKTEQNLPIHKRLHLRTEESLDHKSSRKEEPKLPPRKDSKTEFSYSKAHFRILKKVGAGTFGTVYKAEVVETKEIVAIKRVLQDKRYKNREHPILKQLQHPNLIRLKHSFLTNQYLNLVTDFSPFSLVEVVKNQPISPSQLMLYSFQLLKALSYLDFLGIAHRDLKPHNILIKDLQLQVCDLGSAKRLSPEQFNISYICSRCYRAPELILGANYYTTKIDVWSAACVITEMVTQSTLFTGESNNDQFAKIVAVLGTPTSTDYKEMNLPKEFYTCFENPVKIHGKGLTRVLRQADPNLIDLLSKMLAYSPIQRISAGEGLKHKYFDQLRQRSRFEQLNKGGQLKWLFEVSREQRKAGVQRGVPEWWNNSG